MRKIWRAAAVFSICGLAMPSLAAAGEHRIGFGYHYWQTVDDLGDLGDIEDDGFANVLSYQYLPGGFLRFEVDLEYFDDGFAGSSKTAYSPQFFVLVGRFLYAGVGVGITQSDGFASGGDWSDPWFAARAGVDLLLFPKLHLDINANYRADAFEDLDRAKSDALTIGASLRLTFL